MAGSLDQKDTNALGTQELQRRSNLLSSDKEQNEGEGSPELTTDQIKEVKYLLKKADEENPGVVCDRDEVKYLAYLERDCTPEQRQDAISELPDHLEKKAEYLKEYLNDVNEHFSIEGQLTDQGQELIDEYKDMTGAERKEAAKKLRVLIRERIQEKKSYQELLQDSPHFSENGQLTPKAQEMFEYFQQSEGAEKSKLKKQLLESVRKHESAEKRCEQFYKIASDLYERGEYFSAETYLESIIKLCDRYLDSPRMQVIREWNERDLANMKDHTEKQREIKKLSILRDHFVNTGNLEDAIGVSEELSQKSDRFLNYTVNRRGEEVIRKEKYKSKYLQDLYQDSWNQHSALLGVQRREAEKKADEERLQKSFHKFYNNSNKADDHTTLLGVAEEETRRLHRDERTDEGDMLKTTYVDNEDIEDFTEEDLSEKTEEQKSEIAINFDKENDHERLSRVKESEDVNTGITRQGGRAVTEIHEIEHLVGEKTKKLTEDFVQFGNASGKIEGEALQHFQENMEERIDSGEFSRNFTHEARQSGIDIVRYAGDFDRSQRELGEFIYEHAETDDAPTSQIINLAEEVRKERDEQRNAA